MLYLLTLMRYRQQCGQIFGGQDCELVSWVMVTRLHPLLINLLSAFRHLHNIPLSDTCSAARHPLLLPSWYPEQGLMETMDMT